MPDQEKIPSLSLADQQGQASLKGQDTTGVCDEAAQERQENAAP